MNKKKNKLKDFIIDVDGVLTTGQFLYSTKGKIFKIFGPDDNDALSLINDKINIRFISADKNGFEISKKRIVNHMGYKLDLVSNINRLDWFKMKFKDLNSVIYMGDGIFDHVVMKSVGYSIAPKNADRVAKLAADFVTKRNGGDRAVAEACLHIKNNFL